MYFLGIDIAKINHVDSLIDLDSNIVINTIKFTNSTEGYQKLKEQITHISLKEIMIAMEATGHYWLSLFSFLTDDGYNVSVYNPFQIKSFRGAFNNRKQKNDVIDAIIIANYLRTFGSKNISLPDDSLLSLKQLTRFRTNLVDNVSALKNQTISILDKVFPEFASLFSDAFGETAKQILLIAPTPNEILKLNSKRLYNLVNKASKGRFKTEFVTKLADTAKNSFDIKISSSVCSFEIKQVINQIVFIENQISDLEEEIHNIYQSLDSHLILIQSKI